jgi:hypothetical protein
MGSRADVLRKEIRQKGRRKRDRGKGMEKEVRKCIIEINEDTGCCHRL